MVTHIIPVVKKQLNTLNDNQVIKRIIEDHKNLLMLKDNKASLTNIKPFFNITASLHNQTRK